MGAPDLLPLPDPEAPWVEEDAARILAACTDEREAWPADGDDEYDWAES